MYKSLTNYDGQYLGLNIPCLYGPFSYLIPPNQLQSNESMLCKSIKRLTSHAVCSTYEHPLRFTTMSALSNTCTSILPLDLGFARQAENGKQLGMKVELACMTYESAWPTIRMLGCGKPRST